MAASKMVRWVIVAGIWSNLVLAQNNTTDSGVGGDNTSLDGGNPTNTSLGGDGSENTTQSGSGNAENTTIVTQDETNSTAGGGGSGAGGVSSTDAASTDPASTGPPTTAPTIDLSSFTEDIGTEIQKDTLKERSQTDCARGCNTDVSSDSGTYQSSTRASGALPSTNSEICYPAYGLADVTQCGTDLSSMDLTTASLSLTVSAHQFYLPAGVSATTSACSTTLSSNDDQTLESGGAIVLRFPIKNVAGPASESCYELKESDYEKNSNGTSRTYGLTPQMLLHTTFRDEMAGDWLARRVFDLTMQTLHYDSGSSIDSITYRHVTSPAFGANLPHNVPTIQGYSHLGFSSYGVPKGNVLWPVFLFNSMSNTFSMEIDRRFVYSSAPQNLTQQTTMNIIQTNLDASQQQTMSDSSGSPPDEYAGSPENLYGVYRNIDRPTDCASKCSGDTYCVAFQIAYGVCWTLRSPALLCGDLVTKVSVSSLQEMIEHADVGDCETNFRPTSTLSGNWTPYLGYEACSTASPAYLKDASHFGTQCRDKSNVPSSSDPDDTTCVQNAYGAVVPGTTEIPGFGISGDLAIQIGKGEVQVNGYARESSCTSGVTFFPFFPGGNNTEGNTEDSTVAEGNPGAEQNTTEGNPGAEQNTTEQNQGAEQNTTEQNTTINTTNSSRLRRLQDNSSDSNETAGPNSGNASTTAGDAGLTSGNASTAGPTPGNSTADLSGSQASTSTNIPEAEAASATDGISDEDRTRDADDGYAMMSDKINCTRGFGTLGQVMITMKTTCTATQRHKRYKLSTSTDSTALEKEAQSGYCNTIDCAKVLLVALNDDTTLESGFGLSNDTTIVKKIDSLSTGDYAYCYEYGCAEDDKKKTCFGDKSKFDAKYGDDHFNTEKEINLVCKVSGNMCSSRRRRTEAVESAYDECSRRRLDEANYDSNGALTNFNAQVAAAAACEEKRSSALRSLESTTDYVALAFMSAGAETGMHAFKIEKVKAYPAPSENNLKVTLGFTLGLSNLTSLVDGATISGDLKTELEPVVKTSIIDSLNNIVSGGIFDESSIDAATFAMRAKYFARRLLLEATELQSLRGRRLSTNNPNGLEVDFTLINLPGEAAVTQINSVISSSFGDDFKTTFKAALQASSLSSSFDNTMGDVGITIELDANADAGHTSAPTSTGTNAPADSDTSKKDSNTVVIVAVVVSVVVVGLGAAGFYYYQQNQKKADAEAAATDEPRV